MTTIVVTVAVWDGATNTKHVREIVIQDRVGPPRRMRSKALSETRKALDALVPDR